MGTTGEGREDGHGRLPWDLGLLFGIEGLDEHLAEFLELLWTPDLFRE
jgi:hypothetical protein